MLMEENVNPALEPNVDQRIAELEAKLTETQQRYAASSEEGKRLAQQLRETQQYVLNARPEIPQRQRPEERLAESGIPADAIAELVNDRVGQLLNPMVQQAQGQLRARASMISNYGKDFLQFEQDAMQYVHGDPEVQEKYFAIANSGPQGPVAAAEYGFLKFAEHRRKTVPSEINGADTRAQQAQAAVPSPGRNEGRQPGNAMADRIANAFEAYTKNPTRENAEAYAKARFKVAIPDDWLIGGQMNR